MTKVDLLVNNLKKYVGSSFDPVNEGLLSKIETKYPNIPKEIKELYSKLGYGVIGDSRYMVHVPTEPSEIYDKETSKFLKGILIVGDDFAGTCEAYDVKDNWKFGSIGPSGKFEVYGKETPTFISFLTDWYGNGE